MGQLYPEGSAALCSTLRYSLSRLALRGVQGVLQRAALPRPSVSSKDFQQDLIFREEVVVFINFIPRVENPRLRI